MKLITSTLAAVFLSLTFVAHASLAASQKTQLALNWKPEPQFGGFYAAEISGAFKKNGLEVEILQGGAGTPVVQMVAAGKVEFGIVSADEVVISRTRGGDVVALFAAYQTNPQGIMARAERGFKNLSDLYRAEGTLALQKGLPYAMFLTKKFSSAKVKIVPYNGGIATFLTDPLFSQQCFVTSEPLAAKKAGMKVQTFLVADEGYNPYTTVVVTRGETLKKKPDLVKAMIASLRLGWREYLDRPMATNQLMASLNKSMDAATFIESAEAQKVLIETAETKKSGLGHMTEERWKKLTDQLLDLGVIKKAPETKSLFTNL